MIEIKNLFKKFGNSLVLEDVNLKIEDHYTLIIQGPSGCGKTTLLRLIAGLEMPDQGEIYMDGELVSRKGYLLAPHQRNIGFVFQDIALWPHLSVAQNIAFGIQNKNKIEKKGIVQKLLHKVSLEGKSDRFPNELSIGEQRRVAIARAVAVKPTYLIMDEPLVNLNSDLKTDMLDMIQKIHRELNNTLIYVTHDKDEAKSLKGKRIMLANGKTIE